MLDLNWSRLFHSFKISMLIAVGLGVFFSAILFFVFSVPPGLLVGTFGLGIGGIYLVIAGFIGPGRYQPRYNLLLYTPERGSSYSDTFEVTAFTVDPVSSADVVINGHVIKPIEFKDNFGSVQISRSDVISQPINHIWLESGGDKSNPSYFTFFDYHEDMTDEEIEELYEAEHSKPSKPIEQAREDYIAKLNASMGSIALGIGIAGITSMLIGYVFDLIFIG